MQSFFFLILTTIFMANSALGATSGAATKAQADGAQKSVDIGKRTAADAAKGAGEVEKNKCEAACTKAKEEGVAACEKKYAQAKDKAALVKCIEGVQLEYKKCTGKCPSSKK